MATASALSEMSLKCVVFQEFESLYNAVFIDHRNIYIFFFNLSQLQ